VIDARGGSNSGNSGGGGSGGAIRLVANTINNQGTIYVNGGNGQTTLGYGGGGLVRFEAFTVTGVNGVAGGLGFALSSIPYNLSLPAGGPSTLGVSSVNGVSVNANPFSFPDATINTSSAVPVVISGTNIPSGTTGNLYVFSESAPDQAFPFTLTGTLQSTTATVNVSYPSGGSRGFATVTWKSQ